VVCSYREYGLILGGAGEYGPAFLLHRIVALSIQYANTLKILDAFLFMACRTLIMFNFIELLKLGKLTKPHKNISLPWLSFLQSCIEPVTMSVLAEKTMISTASTTLIADGLVQRGLVTRKDHPNDRRKVIVHITKKGTKYLEDAIFAVSLPVESQAQVEGIEKC